MFENFFDSPARVKKLRSRPSGRLLEGFAKNLYQKGYAEITARKHIRAAEHFMYWTDRDGIPVSRLAGKPRPTPHSLRHTFAVRALETCPDNRDHITQHILALSTYLGHSNVSYTYWYLEATPDLMRNIAERCESFVTGGQS